MTYEGVLTKMQTEFGEPIQYYLVFEYSFLNVNQLLGKPMEINFAQAYTENYVWKPWPNRRHHTCYGYQRASRDSKVDA